jgi:hypothetical protein
MLIVLVFIRGLIRGGRGVDEIVNLKQVSFTSMLHCRLRVTMLCDDCVTLASG